jgi:hypothetical protein
MEKFENTKGVIRSRKSKKDRQYNGQLYLGNQLIDSHLLKKQVPKFTSTKVNNA